MIIKTKKNIIIIVAVLIMVFIAFKIYKNPCFGQSITKQAKDNCYIKQAVKNQDEYYCSLLKDKYTFSADNNLMGACYTELAVLNKDSSYCERITGKYLDIVKSDCYTASAFAKNDPTMCSKYISSYNNNFCYSWFSHKRNDPSLCSNIWNTDQKQECFWRHETNYWRKGFFFCDELVSPITRNLCNQVDI